MKFYTTESVANHFKCCRATLYNMRKQAGMPWPASTLISMDGLGRPTWLWSEQDIVLAGEFFKLWKRRKRKARKAGVPFKTGIGSGLRPKQENV